MWRHIASNALTLSLVLLFLAGGGLLFARGQYSEPGPLAQAICLKVDRGSNFRRVSSELEKQEAISSGFLFRVGADYADKTDKLKAGSYLIEPSATMAEITDQITGLPRGGNPCDGTGPRA